MFAMNTRWVLNKDFVFFLITVVKDKKMQENLTLVVSWNVGENQWRDQVCTRNGEAHTSKVAGIELISPRIADVPNFTLSGAKVANL